MTGQDTLLIPSITSRFLASSCRNEVVRILTSIMTGTVHIFVHWRGRASVNQVGPLEISYVERPIYFRVDHDGSRFESEGRDLLCRSHAPDTDLLNDLDYMQQMALSHVYLSNK